MQEITVFRAALVGAFASIVIIAVVGIMWRMIWSICRRRQRPPPLPTNSDPVPSDWYSKLAGVVGVRGAGRNFSGSTPYGGDGGGRNQGHELNPVVPQYIPARAEWPKRPEAVATRSGRPEGSAFLAAKPPVLTEGEGSRAKAGIPQGAAVKEVRLHVSSMDGQHRTPQAESSER